MNRFPHAAAFTALLLTGCDVGDFAYGVGRALAEGEHYDVKDGRVIWVSHPSMGSIPRRVEQPVAADAATFRVAEDKMYGLDATAVFCKGEPLEGGDPQDFRLLPHSGDERVPVATDGRKVWLSCDEIEGADGATFRFLDGRYGTDGKSVFIATSRIDGADPASLEILDPEDEVSRDASRAYAGTFPIPTDAPRSIRSLGAGYSTDGHRVYWRQFLADGADPATFEVRADERFGRDGSGCWNGPRPQPCLTP